jgi:hypothetical protein
VNGPAPLRPSWRPSIGLVPLEDGKRDEHVRDVYRLSGSDTLSVIHYSRYSDEPTERMDLAIRLRRAEHPVTKSNAESNERR